MTAQNLPRGQAVRGGGVQPGRLVEMAGRLTSARASRQTFERANEFAALAGALVAPWMFWSGWELHVACDRCADRGEKSPCWGVTACHGFDRGCGCRACTDRQRRAQQRAEGDPMGTTEVRGLRRGDRVHVDPRTADGTAPAPGGPGEVLETFTPGRATGERVVLVGLDQGPAGARKRLVGLDLVHLDVSDQEAARA